MARAFLGAVTLALGLLAAQPRADAREVFSGLDLITNCEDLVICKLFLMGVLDAHWSLSDWNRVEPTICAPQTLSIEQLWALVLAFFYDNGDRLEFESTAGSLSLIALENRHPCRPQAAAEPAMAATPISRFYIGLELILACANPIVCETFLIGVLDGYQTLVDWGRIDPIVCLPEDVTNRELMFATLTYLGENQEQLQFTAGSLTLLALNRNYPCR